MYIRAMAGTKGPHPIGAKGSRLRGSISVKPSAATPTRTANSTRFITVIIMMASLIPMKLTMVNTTVVSRERRAMLACGKK